MTKHIKIHLLNTAILGQRCGYGEGRTHAEAVKNALKLARDYGYQDAAYSAQSGCVEFRTAVYL